MWAGLCGYPGESGCCQSHVRANEKYMPKGVWTSTSLILLTSQLGGSASRRTQTAAFQVAVSSPCASDVGHVAMLCNKRAAACQEHFEGVRRHPTRCPQLIMCRRHTYDLGHTKWPRVGAQCGSETFLSWGFDRELAHPDSGLSACRELPLPRQMSDA